MYKKHLFRGKRLDTKEQEWVKGGYYEHDFLVGNAQFIIAHGQFISIDPDTLGQYSTFRDKKGIEIYEDDIVKWIDCGEKIGIVRLSVFMSPHQKDRNWKTHEYGFYIEWVIGNDLENTITSFGTLADELEVVGNIHDCSELQSKAMELRVAELRKLQSRDEIESES